MTDKIIKITLDEKALIRGDRHKDRRDRAITDLIEENSFQVANATGPYEATLTIVENRLVFLLDDAQQTQHTISLSLGPLRRLVKDYSIICDSYFEAVRSADPRKTEAIDMGRRGVHNEGAEIVEELLKPHAIVDFDTSRKLFFLIFVMQSA